mgnify:CR=1 FL=1
MDCHFRVSAGITANILLSDRSIRILGNNPSNTYKLMIYFAHSTLVMYSKDIETHKEMTVGEFMQKYPELFKRVFDEGFAIMNYQLSHEQLQKAAIVYLQSKHFPSSVSETDVYKTS